VLFGGISAGLIINAIELLFHRVLLDKQWTAAFAALGKKPTGWTTFVPSNLLLGSFAVALYAWLRPRYSPTWKSAALAASVIWLAFWVIPTMALMPLNLFPNDLLLATIGIGVLDLLLAVPVGIGLYEER
jgi:peptidoglycan/LPS O-acetylase OafA/YrhL